MSDHPLLTEIDAFCDAHGITEAKFGVIALKDWKFVRQLRDGRRLWPETETKVRKFMVTYRAAEQDAAA